LKTEVFDYEKIVNKTFYENGDLKETKSYHEELKNTL
jgi:hypothetical protein